MKATVQIPVNALRTIKLTFQAAVIVVTVFGFVFLSYLDLTRPDTVTRVKIETSQAAL